MIHIIDNIYLSNLRDASDLQLIQKNNIKIVCRLSEDNNRSIYGPYVLFYNFEIEDNILYKKEIIEIAREITDIARSTKNNVLIHCNEGQSRSPAVIIFYLIAMYECSYETAFEFVKAKKPDIKPNSAFVAALKAFSDHR